jgi:prolyl oligopeptidase
LVFFNTKIFDPYYNLSELKGSSLDNWFKLQDSIVKNYFSSKNEYSSQLKRLTTIQVSNEGNPTLITVSENRRYFYLRYDTIRQKDVLLYRKTAQDQEKELYEPSDDLEVNYLAPSYDGKYIAVGFNPKDNFTSKVIVVNVDNGTILADTIKNINPDYGGVEWLPDNNGFAYLYFPHTNRTSKDFKTEAYTIIHRINKDSTKREVVFKDAQSHGSEGIIYPKVKISSSQDRYVIGYMADSGDFYDSFVSKMSDFSSGQPKWNPLFKKSDSVYWDQGEVLHNELIYRKSTAKGNELRSISLENGTTTESRILIKGSAENPIIDFALTRNNIYFSQSRFGVEVSLTKIKNTGTDSIIPMPFIPGYLSFYGSSTAHDSIGIAIDGWTSDYKRFWVLPDDRIIDEGLIKDRRFPEFDSIVSKQVQVKSHDGVQVPLSLVFKKNTNLNSENRVFIYVYGAYGESMSPFYSPIFLDWVAQGGILAFPHVRGGGEKGVAWHQAGMKENKFNSWLDLNACADYLISKGYTSAKKIALYTNSAGGITAGMAVNIRPDLYGAFIAEVSRLNPLGLEMEDNAKSSSYLEYGTIKDSIELKGLIAMDPYLNLGKPLKDFPATLIMPSFNDDRIPIWDNAKYIARLQQNYSGSNPILFDVDFSSGHENKADLNSYLRGYAKIFTFASLNTN